MRKISNLENTILTLLEDTSRNLRATPLNLGGISGIGGGVGTIPGGFIGQLTQSRVAYDTDELATDYTPASGMSLLDNLNHIRERIGVLESGGSITVVDNNTPASFYDVDTIEFSGGVILTDLGGGNVRVVVTASGGGGGGIPEAPVDSLSYLRNNSAWVSADAEYFRLDTANRPITGKLEVYAGVGESATTYLQGDGDVYVLDAEQYTINDAVTSPVEFLYRETSGTGNITAPLMEITETKLGAGNITGPIWQVTSLGSILSAYTPNIVNSGLASLYFDTNTVITASGELLSLRNDGTEKFYVNGSGIAYSSEGKLIPEAPLNSILYGRIDGGWSTTTDVQIFTSSGNWTKPTGAKSIQVILYGGGGGGGGGKSDATGSSRAGGSGGGGGARTEKTINAVDITSPASVTVGTGGGGGAGGTGSNGTNGAGGGISSFHNKIFAGGGGGGLGGVNLTLSGGGGGGSIGSGQLGQSAANSLGGLPSTTAGLDGTGGGGAGGVSANTGRNAENGGGGGGGSVYNNTNSVHAGSSINGGGGGGGGSSRSSGNVDRLAGEGGKSLSYAVGGGGAAGSTTAGVGSNGNDGTDGDSSLGGDGGGGGGSATGSNVVGNGGAGGVPAGGGGGGGVSGSAAVIAGNGGDGGEGLVIVITHF